MKQLSSVPFFFLLIALVGSGCGANIHQQIPPITLSLAAKQSTPSESGTATLTQTSDQTQTTVTIQIANQPTGETQYAFFQYGTCANLTPSPLYPLTNVVNGASNTTYNFPLVTMKSEGPGDGGGHGPGGPGGSGSVNPPPAPSSFAIAIYRYNATGITLLSCADHPIG